MEILHIAPSQLSLQSWVFVELNGKFSSSNSIVLPCGTSRASLKCSASSSLSLGPNSEKCLEASKTENVTRKLIHLTGRDAPFAALPVETVSKVPKAKELDLTNLLEFIDQCTNVMQLKQIHAHMLRTSLFFDPYIASKLLTVYGLSSFSSLRYAQRVFDQILQPNLYCWNTLIRAYASSSDPTQSLLIFSEMLYSCSEFPNKFSFPFVFKAASEIAASHYGRILHGMVIKASLASDLFILNSLIHFYGSSGDLDSAHIVFSKIPQKDVVSWNSMINAFAQGGSPEKALHLFKQMEIKNVKPNKITMVGVLSACAKKLDLEFGRWICSYIERNDIVVDLTLNNAILDMYVKCGSIDDAQKLFDRMPEKDIVSWTTMLDGYAKSGNYDEAQLTFDAMPHKETAAWNALISAYAQSGRPKEALSLFHEMQLSENAKPDEITLVASVAFQRNPIMTIQIHVKIKMGLWLRLEDTAMQK
ncbi:hypothetical protein L6164_006827 [Bauhinia variegata]|uniref:Uncharacterized protein n=1 Tax=Bauhinia variegata TaxID=167791 RepID=A0ACB9PW63_BAUVA|nr:hypothetical protein L6164_006827 [Bauhinia variegata]